jgi:hypothetical protein
LWSNLTWSFQFLLLSKFFYFKLVTKLLPLF